eukprot:scaffold185845_cov17-Prasinocladus_malaysianus.AAC.1
MGIVALRTAGIGRTVFVQWISHCVDDRGAGCKSKGGVRRECEDSYEYAVALCRGNSMYVRLLVSLLYSELRRRNVPVPVAIRLVKFSGASCTGSSSEACPL